VTDYLSFRSSCGVYMMPLKAARRVTVQTEASRARVGGSSLSTCHSDPVTFSSDVTHGSFGVESGSGHSGGAHVTRFNCKLCTKLSLTSSSLFALRLKE